MRQAALTLKNLVVQCLEVTTLPWIDCIHGRRNYTKKWRYNFCQGSGTCTIKHTKRESHNCFCNLQAGERLRIEYEKRLTHLRNQDVKGEEPSSVDKTRAALRSLHTRLKVSIHTVQSISRRIEVLRDEELHPQLMELIHGYASVRYRDSANENFQYTTTTCDHLIFFFLGAI